MKSWLFAYGGLLFWAAFVLMFSAALVRTAYRQELRRVACDDACTPLSGYRIGVGGEPYACYCADENGVLWPVVLEVDR